MKNRLTDKEIDALVTKQADNDDAWGKPIRVNRKISLSIRLPIEVDKAVLSRIPVFEGTTVPVAALFDNLEIGVSLDEFLEKFPAITREEAVEVLEYCKHTLGDFKKAA